MKPLQSKINTRSQQFLANKAEMLKLVEKLEQHLEESRFQGKEKHINRARKRGKLLARERLELVLDRDSPFLELLPLAGMGTKGGFGAGGKQTNFSLLVLPSLHQRSPAIAVLAAVFLVVVPLGIQWPMRRVVSEVQKKGLVTGLACLGNVLASFISECVSSVKAIGSFNGTFSFRDDAISTRLEIVDRPRKAPIKLFKATTSGPAFGTIHAQVPFTRHHRLISRCAKNLRQRGAVLVQVALIGPFKSKWLPRRCGHVANTGLVRLQPGHQAGTCWTASPLVVELGKSQSTSSQRVDVRRFNFASIAANIRETHIVDQNHNHVRPR